VLVRDFEHGADLDLVLLVREVDRRASREGGEFLKVLLGDRTGAVTAIVREDVTAALEACRAGSPVQVVGRYEVHPRFGPQIAVQALGAAVEGRYSPADLQDGPLREIEHMEADFRELVATVQSPHLRRLLDVFFGEQCETWALYRLAPAAKRYHHAYLHGLLEHCLTVAQAVGAISATFPGIDRDTAVTGALLHDIGKLEAYTADPPIDLTDDGRLQGEIPLGYYRVRRAIEELDGFPTETARAVLHIILSHHGSLEHGSPVVPCTREATLVHMMDNLGGRLGSFDRLEKQLSPGAAWSTYDRALGTGAYFGSATSAASATITASDRRSGRAEAA
jgi:3'-5' exoribonuclease